MNNGKTSVAIGALLIAAVTLSATAFSNSQSCCMGKKHKSGKQGPPVEATRQDGAQTAIVEINSKGFEPGSLKLKAGVPAKVTFVRKTDESCAKEVVIKDYDIERKLPLNQPVTVEFTPRKGEFGFACGMNMVKGKLIVE
jgi:plastocyanin domain-containing protein